MKKRPEILFGHMLMAIEEIERYIEGYNYQSFVKDSKTVSAVVRQLEIVGEAAGRVPRESIKDSPIAWDKITGMRHKLIHDYFGVDTTIVWKTVTEGLGPLKRYLNKKL